MRRKRTTPRRYTPPTDRSITRTALCETGRHYACRGELVSLTVPAGTPCDCGCHDGNDLALAISIERAGLADLDLIAGEAA
jgi:hypothetical protein